MAGGPGPSGTNAACAACKYQRRKCAPDCPLAPYFPPDQPKRFHNVHKLFGVSNILRILRSVEPSKREDTVKSIVYEADTREKDPVYGCLGVISLLQNQVTKLKEELGLMRDQLYLMEQQQQASSILNQTYDNQHGPGQGDFLHHQLQQYGTLHPSGYQDTTGQPSSFHDSKSLQSIYHDHSRYADSGALHDMLEQQLKVEAAGLYNRAGMSQVRYGAECSSTQEQQASSSTLAELQRRSVYNQLPDTHVTNHDTLRSLARYQGLIPLNNQSQTVPDHELRNAGVHLSLTNQYSI